MTQKRAAFFLIFLIAGPFPSDPRRQIRLGVQPFGQRRDPLVRIDGRAVLGRQSGVHSGLDVKVAFLVDPADPAQFRDRFAGDKVRQRHQTVAGADLERVQCRQNAVIFGQAHADFDFLVRAGHPHRIKQQPARHKLNHAAHGGHVRAVPACLFHIHVQLPVDPRQGQGVLDIGKGCRALKLGAHHRGRLQQVVPVVALQAQVHRFRGRRPTRQFQDLGLDPRQVL